MGKSSLINSLLETNIAETSNYPGKTRHLWFYKVAANSGIYLVDAPGYGFSEASKKEVELWSKMMNKYFEKSIYLHRSLVLIDS